MNINILRQIEDDLDLDEKISILFLIIEDYANAFTCIFNLYQKAKREKAYIIIDYVKSHPENWEDKVLEALCIVNNCEVLGKLRVSFDILNRHYVPKIRLSAQNVNVIAKCLYDVCESLDEDEQNLLIRFVKSENSNYEPLLDNVDCLELHMLYWMQIKYITISKDREHLIRLLKHLASFANLQTICWDLEKFDNHLHYETRYGTNADCASLSETFQAFGFTVCKHENLVRKEILKKISNIPKDHGNTFDCMFLCILSHGYTGGIISSDEQEVSLIEIERAVCCMELKDVIKIVIIQACQGKTRGIINDNLARDGLYDTVPKTEDTSKFENFYMFMSTLQGFLSIRHKEEGSWFIQEVCRVLKTYGNQLTFLECVREIMTSVRKKKGTIEGNRVAQLAEVRPDRLQSDFQLQSAADSVV
ncbi:Caspase-10 [Ooceraea biroi]|uniref:Caspase-10 n=1 Tax=Ooceraea biroi TaxID=2015173 RepID=A0A026WDB3_OOCBI|nr:Caspase-10 [Ooceraea biroi]